MQQIYRRILNLLHILEHLFIRTPAEGSFCNNNWIVRPSVDAFLKIFRTNLLQNNRTAACELLLLAASQLVIVQIPQWNIRAVCEICSTFTIKAPARSQLRRPGAFTISFSKISPIIFLFPLLTLNK